MPAKKPLCSHQLVILASDNHHAISGWAFIQSIFKAYYCVLAENDEPWSLWTNSKRAYIVWCTNQPSHTTRLVFRGIVGLQILEKLIPNRNCIHKATKDCTKKVIIWLLGKETSLDCYNKAWRLKMSDWFLINREFGRYTRDYDGLLDSL